MSIIHDKIFITTKYEDFLLKTVDGLA